MDRFRSSFSSLTVACFHRHAPGFAALVVTLCAIAATAEHAGSVDGCKAKVGRDGVIDVQASNVQGVPSWQAGQQEPGQQPEPNEFFNQQQCVQGDALKHCQIGDPQTDAGKQPPASCTIVVKDDNSQCSSFIKGCGPTPGDVSDDGIIRINQARALSGSVTPGDTPGFPVTINRPGSYRLTSNITTGSADQTAIVISTEFVNLDLNGFLILGPSTSPPCGVDAGYAINAVKGATIHNGSIKGFAIGVAAQSGARVDEIRAFGNCTGIDVRGQAIVTRSITLHNDHGIVFRGNTLLDRNISQLNDTDDITPLTVDDQAIQPGWIYTDTDQPTVRPTIEPEQFAATGTGTFAASMPTVIGD